MSEWVRSSSEGELTSCRKANAHHAAMAVAKMLHVRGALAAHQSTSGRWRIPKPRQGLCSLWTGLARCCKSMEHCSSWTHSLHHGVIQRKQASGEPTLALAQCEMMCLEITTQDIERQEMTKEARHRRVRLPILSVMREKVIIGDRDEVVVKVREALEGKIIPEDILNEGLIAGMAEVGERFERDELYVPEMLRAARAMKAGLAVLQPHLVEAGTQAAGKVVIGTVEGDLHDIGKNLVGAMLEGAGFEVIDLGINVPAEEFAAAVRERSADIVAMSTLLTTTMDKMRSTIEVLVGLGLREGVKVLVGGAPVTDAFANRIGADGYAPNASRAVSIAKDLL